MEIRRLNIGSGTTVIEGFTPIDRAFGDEAWPLKHHNTALIGDDTIHEMRASHVLEHFGHGEVDAVLRNWYDKLVPGTGLIRIAVPDYDIIQEMRKACESGDLNGWDLETVRLWPLYLMGGQTDENDHHHTIFTRDGLEQRLRQAGFDDIREWEDDEPIDTASHPVSLRLEAQKPIVVGPGVPGHTSGLDDLGDMPPGKLEPIRNPAPGVYADADPNTGMPTRSAIDINICAMMTRPRYGCLDASDIREAALSPRQIPMVKSGGAFWDQGMQNPFEDCVEKGVDWLITMDYDSFFTAEDIDRMLQHMGDNPEIECLAALQPRRNKPFPLMTIKGRTQIEMPTQRPIEVDTAHFGLTIIKLAALENVPKPWFWAQPGEDGTWRHFTRMDADIYFWHIWKQAGHKVWVAPDVRIGHMQEMISEFDENHEIRYLHIVDWMERNYPGAVKSVD